MKLNKYFDTFLEDTVNLNPYRMELLDTRTTAITKFLKGDKAIGPLLKETIPQGSFAQKTIIRPRVDGHFDADLLVHLGPTPDWNPGEYVGKLYTALGRSPVYRETRHRRTRCVYIDYADEFHVDLVPYVENGDLGFITNNKTKEFELTDPEGFTGWLKDQHRATGGHLIKVIRLLKFIRDRKWAVNNPRSVILTTLIGERVSQLKPASEYADVPTTLCTVVGDIDAYLQANATMPPIKDPGGTGDRFDARWDQDSYTAFRTRIHSLREKIDTAIDPDKSVADSLKAWQEIFGTEFKAPSTTTASSRSAEILVEGSARPVTERFLDLDYGIPIIDQSGYTVRISGQVLPRQGFRHGRLPEHSNQVGKQRDLRFEIESCTVPQPYEIYWKVRNTGVEARRAGGLRGEIRQGRSTLTESTAYTGSHWVECYIVKNNRCLARARQPVIVG